MYYIKRLRRFRWLYKTLTKWSRRYLEEDEYLYISEFIENKSDDMIKSLPDIGGKKNIFSMILVLNGWFVLFYKAMCDLNQSVERVAFINREVSIRLFSKVPRSIGILIGGIAFKKMGKAFFNEQALKTQEKAYPDDFLYTFHVVKQKEVEFRFTECAVHKFYDREEAVALKAYCNFADPLYSERFRMGCNAEHSFANGEDICILNYNRLRPTETPSNIVKLISKYK